MTKNQLYTKGYVIQRLRTAGFKIKPISIDYELGDDRYWTVIVNSPTIKGNLIVTCFRNSLNCKRGLFTISGSGFFNYQIDTKSVEVLIEQINSLLESYAATTGNRA